MSTLSVQTSSLSLFLKSLHLCLCIFVQYNIVFLDVDRFGVRTCKSTISAFTFCSSPLPCINLHTYTLKLAEQQSVSVGVWGR